MAINGSSAQKGGRFARFAKCAFCITACMMLAFALAGCTDAASKDSGGTETSGVTGLEKVTFALDYVPNTNHTGIYVAIDKGYYRDVGLEVEVVQPPEDGADALVGTGKADLGISFQDFMANYLGSANPLPVTAVAAVVQHNTSGIMSRAGEGADHPAGMAGKRYATWEMDAEKAIIRNLVESDGGSWDEVELVPSNSTDEVSGLRANMFDTVWCYEGWGMQNAILQSFPFDYFSLREFDEVFDYYTPVIIANDGFLEAHPDAVRKFLAATAKGYEFASREPGEATDILVRLAPGTDPELAAASQEFLASRYVDDSPQWGYIDPARWNRFYSWMNDNGLVEVPIGEDAGFTNEFLPEG